MSQATATPPRGHAGGADRVIGGALATVAAVWHASLMTRATNDNFLHLTFAQQWLRGDWPVRDFFDQGWVLQYSLSAAAQLLLGDRLAAEAIIVGLGWAVSTALVYATVHRLAKSRTIAIAAALLPILASARGYSYPKGIVYAVAAALWWAYVTRPATRRVVAFGGWTAVAFYWRPDHGVYVAIGLVLAVLAAHGFTRTAVRRCALAGFTTIAAMVPFVAYVQLSYGLAPYVQTGLTQAEVEHATQGTHEWPLVRYGSRLVTVEPAERYAPTIGVRWNPNSSPQQRQDVRARYGLASRGTDPDGVEQVRLEADAGQRLRALINEPIIDDTAGVDRSAGIFAEQAWPTWQRRKFSYRLLRLQVLPDLDSQTAASELVAALFFLFPIALIVAAPWLSRRSSGPPPRVVAAFGLFALLVSWAMIRNPFPARVADGVVLSSIAFGCCLGAMWRGSSVHRFRTPLLKLCAMSIAAVVVIMVSVAGRFENPVDWLNGSRESYRELMASPPLAYYIDRRARFSLRLAAYVRDCVPVDDRVLVLWFEPEIYYFSDRLMAQRHAVFAPAWSALEAEQRVTLAKVERFRPPIVLARTSALDRDARASYPRVVDYVMKEYALSNRVEDAGEEYLIYTRRDRPALRRSEPLGWPCFTPDPSPWSRVGLTK